MSALGRKRTLRDPLRLASRGSLQHPLRRLDVHAFDHFLLEALGTAAEGLNQPRGAIEFGLGRRERAVARVDLGRMDQAFAVEAKAPAFLGLTRKPIEIVENVV